jgi:hypothetical protein
MVSGCVDCSKPVRREASCIQNWMWTRPSSCSSAQSGLVMQSLLAGDVARIRRDAPAVFAIYLRGITHTR